METESQTVAVELTRFTAADIAEITGVSRHVQRDWRRRGLTGPRAHHIADLVIHYLTARLKKIMGGPAPAGPVARLFMPAILWRAALDERAWAPDSLAGDRHARALLVVNAIGQDRPPEDPIGAIFGETTMIAPDHLTVAEFIRRTGATDPLVILELDEIAADFMRAMNGRPFARLDFASPREAAALTRH